MKGVPCIFLSLLFDLIPHFSPSSPPFLLFPPEIEKKGSSLEYNVGIHAHKDTRARLSIFLKKKKSSSSYSVKLHCWHSLRVRPPFSLSLLVLVPTAPAAGGDDPVSCLLCPLYRRLSLLVAAPSYFAQ